MNSNILDKIIENKKLELQKLKKLKPLSNFRSKIKPSTRDFKKAISKNALNLIAEIKKASPSAGKIAKSFNPVRVASIYNNYADAISIITDKKFFKGDIRYFKKIDKITEVPLLRKDFIIDKYQIYESRYNGADAILLIAGILSIRQINKFISIAKKLNMHCLVEVHTKEELKKVLKTKAEIIGINNRNLKNFKISLNTTLDLLKSIPKNCIIISESGFNSLSDIKKVKNKVNSVLIGTSIMQSSNIEQKLKQLSIPKIKICGITQLKDALLASKLGATYLGFIFYKKSPRYISPKKASSIITKLPNNILKVGIFVNEPLNNVKKIAKQLKLNLIQLHGNESQSYCNKLKLPIIKAFRVKNKLKLIHKTPYCLFDTFTSKYGGSGKVFNWNLIQNLINKKKSFLSGGLNINNIKKAYSLKPYALDVNSGIELKPGVKDPKKLKKLFNKLK